jgi:hypothetical protein
MPGVAGHRNDQALAVPLRAISQSHLPFCQMNFIKTTIATAAVLTCCLGNNYPAAAKDADAWDHGYASGYAISACINYAQDIISRARFVEDVQRAQTHLSSRQADGLITGFLDSSNRNGSEGAKRAFRKCYRDSKHLVNNI